MIFNIQLNRIGVGEKSEILTTKTQGVEPTIPEPQSFLEVSPGSVTLHLNAWENGGCPIVYFVVEYKPRYFSNMSRYHIITKQNHFIVLRLIIIGIF